MSSTVLNVEAALRPILSFDPTKDLPSPQPSLVAQTPNKVFPEVELQNFGGYFELGQTHLCSENESVVLSGAPRKVLPLQLHHDPPEELDYCLHDPTGWFTDDLTVEQSESEKDVIVQQYKLVRSHMKKTYGYLRQVFNNASNSRHVERLLQEEREITEFDILLNKWNEIRSNPLIAANPNHPVIDDMDKYRQYDLTVFMVYDSDPDSVLPVNMNHAIYETLDFCSALQNGFEKTNYWLAGFYSYKIFKVRGTAVINFNEVYWDSARHSLMRVGRSGLNISSDVPVSHVLEVRVYKYWFWRKTYYLFVDYFIFLNSYCSCSTTYTASVSAWLRKRKFREVLSSDLTSIYLPSTYSFFRFFRETVCGSKNY